MARGLCVDAARAALAERGQLPERITESDSGPRLTSRERKVLDLTAAGLDVHQVAQRLFLTPGTVHGVLAAASAKDPGVR